MVHFLDESSRQKLRNLFADGHALLLVEATQALLHRLGAQPDPQGMLSDFPRNAWHIRGFPRKDVFVVTEEVDERTFLFRGKRGTNMYPFSLGAIEVYEDFHRALCRLE